MADNIQTRQITLEFDIGALSERAIAELGKELRERTSGYFSKYSDEIVKGAAYDAAIKFCNENKEEIMERVVNKMAAKLTPSKEFRALKEAADGNP